MIAQKSGKIVFTCSLLSFQGGINVPGYAASKGAIASLLKALSNEWSIHGVNVNGIAPGYIATDNTAQLRADEDRNKSILARIPAGRWGNASDLTGAYLFLSSPASDYVCGTILTVDGFTVLSKLAHVALMDSGKCLVKVPTELHKHP